MKVCVIGLGYIGLPTAALIADSGLRTFGYDINPEVCSNIISNNFSFSEPKLEKMITRVLEDKIFTVHNTIQPADVFVICVPTPLTQTSPPTANIQYVKNAAIDVSKVIKNGDLVIIESTCNIGSTNNIFEIINLSLKNKIEFSIAYCPERIIPGNALDELMNNARVIGGLTNSCSEKAKNFYKMFVKGELHTTSPETAEACKLAENTFRDVNIAFANELSMICDTWKINTLKLIELANNHPRVNIHKPGIGVGGHCIAVDPWFLIQSDPRNTNLIECARNVNTAKTEWVVNKIKDQISYYKLKFKKTPRICFFGLSYKPNIGDLRESPAVHIVQTFLESGYSLRIVEPYICEHSIFELSEPMEAFVDSDIIIVLVAHDELNNLLKRLPNLKNKEIFDYTGNIK